MGHTRPQAGTALPRGALCQPGARLCGQVLPWGPGLGFCPGASWMRAFWSAGLEAGVVGGAQWSTSAQKAGPGQVGRWSVIQAPFAVGWMRALVSPPTLFPAGLTSYYELATASPMPGLGWEGQQE